MIKKFNVYRVVNDKNPHAQLQLRKLEILNNDELHDDIVDMMCKIHKNDTITFDDNMCVICDDNDIRKL
jgi:hypothetical protein